MEVTITVASDFETTPERIELDSLSDLFLLLDNYQYPLIIYPDSKEVFRVLIYNDYIE
jgi:hypothetical protein